MCLNQYRHDNILPLYGYSLGGNYNLKLYTGIASFIKNLSGANHMLEFDLIVLSILFFPGPEACLVYQLMGGGSLEQRLRGKTHHPPLSWVQRYNIVHGVAR